MVLTPFTISSVEAVSTNCFLIGSSFNSGLRHNHVPQSSVLGLITLDGKFRVDWEKEQSTDWSITNLSCNIYSKDKRYLEPLLAFFRSGMTVEIYLGKDIVQSFLWDRQKVWGLDSVDQSKNIFVASLERCIKDKLYVTLFFAAGDVMERSFELESLQSSLESASSSGV